MAAAPVAVAAAAKKHHHAARKKPKPPPPPPRSKDASFDAKLSKIREAIAARETQQQQPEPAPPSLRREVAVAHAPPTTPVAPAKRHHHAKQPATSSGTHKPTGRMQRRAAREVPPDPAPVAAPTPAPVRERHRDALYAARCAVGDDLAPPRLGPEPALDYAPALRAIFGGEAAREATFAGRRFTHYLRDARHSASALAFAYAAGDLSAPH